MKTIQAIDLFCGAGGTSTGLLTAARAMGLDVSLTALTMQTSVKKHLTSKRDMCQPYPVPAIAGIGFRSPITEADSAFNFSGVFLCPELGIAPYLGEPDGEPKGSPVPLCRSANPSGSPILFRSRTGGIFNISSQRSNPMPSAIATPAPFISTPEDYFIPNPDAKKEIPVDALLCAMCRARSVLELIMDNGHNLKDGFLISHTTLMDALWCLSGILEQAEAMIQTPFKKGE